MPSSTVENYLKQIYLEQQPLAGELLPMGRLATAMNVTPGTATTIQAHKLHEVGFAFAGSVHHDSPRT